MKRRTFLKLAGAGGAFIGGSMLAERLSSAVDPPNWGALPTGVWPGTQPNFKILEIFLYGGLSPWESFYFKSTGGSPPLGFAGFDTGGSGTDLIGNMAWSSCTGTPSPSTETLAFANDGAGEAIKLGPFTKPLWSTHLSRRMRVVVLSHTLLPHEAAIPLALSGLRLGRPQLAGMGAPMQRQAYAKASRPLPYSYVCVPMTFTFPTDNLQTTSAVGQHPAGTRPLTLRIGSGTDTLRTMLLRSNMSSNTTALLKQYRSQYRDELRWLGSGDPTRSKGFVEYNASFESLLNSPNLSNLLNAAPLTLTKSPPCTGSNPSTPVDNVPGTAIRLAAYLLTRPSSNEAARYACVIDGGLEDVPSGGGYDTHSSDHLMYTGVNLWNTLSTLADVIKNPTVPRSGDADRINLDDTMIVLTTEFGRTPWRSSQGVKNTTSNGRDHWTSGYVNMLIGGPIASGKHGIAGAINNSGVASAPFTPTDFRAAALMAAGINPFTPDIFGVGDVSAAVSGSADEKSRLIGLREKILNVT